MFQLFAILCLAATFGELLRRWSYPSVIGEILTGIILGPSVLGYVWPEMAATLFPVAHTRYLGSLAWLGSVFLLLLAGTEVDLVVLRKERRVVLWTSLLGIVIPYAFGFALGLRLPDHYLVTPENRTVFALLLATTLSISAIPVVAKILMDLRLLKTSVGQTIIGSAVVNDFVGWIFFAVLLSLITGGPGHETSVAGIVALTVGFATLSLTLGKTLVPRLFLYFHGLDFPAEAILGVAVLIAFVCSALTQWLGIHAIFGAFLAGVMIGETGEITNQARTALRHLVFYIFSPIFFATMGLRTNFVANFDVALVVIFLAIACVGKTLGGTCGALAGGKRRGEALAIAFGVMPQGAMGIILAFSALELSLISETVFVALVTTAILTSILSGPLMKWSLARGTAPSSPSTPGRW